MDILILVCALSVATPDCQEDTAIDAVRMPLVTSTTGCAKRGMLYASQAHLIKPGSYVKVLCWNRTPTMNIGLVQQLAI